MKCNLNKISLKFTDIFIFLIIVSQVIFLYSYFSLPSSIFQVTWFERLYFIFTVSINALICIIFFVVPFLWLAYKVLPAKFFIFIFHFSIALMGLFFMIDYFVFALFKFHLNGFIFTIIQQPLAWEILGFKARDLILMGIIFISIFLFSYCLFAWLRRTSLFQSGRKFFQSWQRRIIFILLIFLLLVFDKTVFSWLRFQQSVSLGVLADSIIYYAAPAMDEFFEDTLGFQPPSKIILPKTISDNHQIQYPQKPYKPTVLTKKPFNIIWLLADAFRSDIVQPEIMPYTSAFMQHKMLRFKNHFSGSNGTSNGMFSLFYGIPASYKKAFTRFRKSPLFIDALLEHQYKIDILSTKGFDWFGSDEIIFFKVRDRLQSMQGDSVSGDKNLTKVATKIIQTRSQKTAEPFFLMVFYDAPHLPHFKAKGYKKFVPENTGFIFDPANPIDREKGMNEYKNAVNFVDDQFAQLFQIIKKQGLLDNTIIIITGDHGSEKYEHGHWGHASAFTNEQLKVPFGLYYPGVQPAEIERMTSHNDVAMTMLELIGETFNPFWYSTGKSLLKTEPHEYIICAGESNRVFIDDQYKIDYLPLSIIPYYQVTDHDDNLIADKNIILQQYTPKLFKMFQQLSRFYQK